MLRIDILFPLDRPDGDGETSRLSKVETAGHRPHVDRILAEAFCQRCVYPGFLPGIACIALK
jgi:hypothetical protein